MKSIFESKTAWLNILSAIVMILQGEQIVALFPPSATPYVAAVVFVVNIVLRYLTDTPVYVGTPRALKRK